MGGIRRDLADLRREYSTQPLRRAELAADPWAQFDRWFTEARDAEIRDPNAMTLATAGDGQPAARTVLLKSYDPQGLVFYTNFDSHKAAAIAANPRVALLFYWQELHRQVKVRGTATRVAEDEAARYFARRPRDSQLAAWASRQSHEITGRDELVSRFESLRDKYDGRDVPMPAFWGGYRVAPSAFEFWQGRDSRLHDRFEYRADGEGGWRIRRLAP